jgi:glc operon protein GlcG
VPARKAAPNAASACSGLMEPRSGRSAIREDMRQKFSLTSDEARAIVTAAKLEAVRHEWKVSIAVVDEGGYLLHLERMDGAPLSSPEIAALKARTAALARVPTKFLEDVSKERTATIMFPGRLPVQGGVPILYAGECVGAVGVSGVKSPEDEQVAMAGLTALSS